MLLLGEPSLDLLVKVVAGCDAVCGVFNSSGAMALFVGEFILLIFKASLIIEFNY